MNEFEKRVLALGEERVLALIEIGIVMRKAIERGATDNSCRTFLKNELGLDRAELTQATLLGKYPLATYSGCTSIAEAKQVFEAEKNKDKLEVERQKKYADMTPSEVEAMKLSEQRTIEKSKENALNDKPNKVAGLQVRRKDG